MRKLITAALCCLAGSASAANLVNDNFDAHLTCDGTPHSISFPESNAPVQIAAWDYNFGGANGMMQWLVVGRQSDAAYLLFTMANQPHMERQYPAPFFNFQRGDAIEITGSCDGAPEVFIKVQVWYAE
jgi:hypothetical protein